MICLLYTSNEYINYLQWLNITDIEDNINFEIVQEQYSKLKISDADTEILLNSEKKQLSLKEYEHLKYLVIDVYKRQVQGGSYFDSSAVVDEDVVNKVEELSDLAPLHNPAHLIGYRAFKEALPQIGHVFVFDTAFHQTMTPESYLFPVPMEWYENYKVRRYGAHGTSQQYVSQRCAELMGKDVKDLKIITCHLGNGASITAVDGGKCINTSMGLTPLGGIMMGTRCGDIDPAIVPFVMKKTGMTPDEMDTALNKKSGMLGISRCV